MKLEWPRLETKTHWSMMGFDKDVNKAMVNTTREAVLYLAGQKMVPRTCCKMFSLGSTVGDHRVTQVAEVREGALHGGSGVFIVEAGGLQSAASMWRRPVRAAASRAPVARWFRRRMMPRLCWKRRSTAPGRKSAARAPMARGRESE